MIAQNFYSEVTSPTDGGGGRDTAIPISPNGQPTGLYIYWEGLDGMSSLLPHTVNKGDRYFLNVTHNNGVRFLADDANSAHQAAECSGRGVCDRTVGSCKCVAGYTGDACQRTACPNDCSGNGICQSEAYFVNDAAAEADALGASYTYGGFDADSAYGCKCDVGFRGADCAQRECPSGPDPMGGDGGAEGMDCSGRGLCDCAFCSGSPIYRAALRAHPFYPAPPPLPLFLPRADTTGVCKCFKGTFGERCEELSTLI